MNIETLGQNQMIISKLLLLAFSLLALSIACVANRMNNRELLRYLARQEEALGGGFGLILTCKEDGKSHRISERYGSHHQVWSFLSLLRIPFETLNISRVHFFFIAKDFRAEATNQSKAVRIITEAFGNTKVSRNSFVIQEGYADRYLWHKDRISQRGPVSGRADVSPFVSTYAGDGVTIYVVDTGIYVDHEEFQGRAQSGRSFTEEYYGPQSQDLNGHGR